MTSSASPSIVWTRQLGTSFSDTAQALTTGPDGAIYLVGSTAGNLDGQINGGTIVDYLSFDAFLTKYNPDGARMVGEWYDKYRDTKWEGGPMPWLYEKYAGHDINRDAFMLNLAENRNLGDVTTLADPTVMSMIAAGLSAPSSED